MVLGRFRYGGRSAVCQQFSPCRLLAISNPNKFEGRAKYALWAQFYRSARMLSGIFWVCLTQWPRVRRLFSLHYGYIGVIVHELSGLAPCRLGVRRETGKE